MKQKLIDKKKYPRQCINCIYARAPKDKSVVLCEKKGIVEKDSCCRSYRYDPLKRVPSKIIIDNSFTKEDFEI